MGCRSENPISPHISYNRVSNEFLSTLLEFGEFDCNCIIEPTNRLLDFNKEETISGEHYNLIFKLTNLSTRREVDSLNKLLKSVDLNKTIKKSKYTLIPKKLIDSVVKIKDRKERILTMDSICPEGFMFISKPIFNTSMDEVFLIIDDMPYSCFPGRLTTFEYINNEWIIL